jgi:hypothetical protein
MIALAEGPQRMKVLSTVAQIFTTIFNIDTEDPNCNARSTHV